jgi:MFS family permease
VSESARRPIFYGWVILAVGFVVIGVAVGILLTLGVFLKPIQAAMGWSRAEISGVALLTWCSMGLGSFLWGMLHDRAGSRVVVAGGAVLLGLGLLASSQVTALWQLYATLGGLVGLAIGAFTAPLTSAATAWFSTNRGLAVALISAGTGIGTFVLAPLSRWLITLYDWRTAMLALAAIVWLTMLTLVWLLREPPDTAGPVRRGLGGLVEPDLSLREVGRTPQFWVLAATHFVCCVSHSGPIFHMVAHASDQGVDRMAAATVFGVAGLTSMVGRLVAGIAADRIGAKPTLVAMLALQAPAIFLYALAHDLAVFYAVSVIFGLAFGGVMPLYALLAREFFGQRAMGGAYGAIYMLQAIAMGLGAFAGGWFHDLLGDYAWFFSAAAAVGVTAVLLALTLRAPRRQVQPA